MVLWIVRWSLFLLSHAWGRLTCFGQWDIANMTQAESWKTSELWDLFIYCWKSYHHGNAPVLGCWVMRAIWPSPQMTSSWLPHMCAPSPTKPTICQLLSIQVSTHVTQQPLRTATNVSCLKPLTFRVDYCTSYARAYSSLPKSYWEHVWKIELYWGHQLA